MNMDTEKKELKEKANLFRQCADILDEIAETEDEDKVEELSAKLLIKMIKLDSNKSV